MTIKTEKSVSADVKTFLLEREKKKEKVLTALTQLGFLGFDVLTGGEIQDELELIADAVDGMLDPINRQVKKITNEQNYIPEKESLLKDIVRLLNAQLTKIVQVKGALVDKDPAKISKSVEELKNLVTTCKEKIEKI